MKNPDLHVVAESDGPVMGLAAKYFTDGGIFERVMEEVFFKSWLLACHSSQVANPGDYLTLAIYHQDVVVTNTKDGGIKAFYNVCQHRGHRLAEGSGNRGGNRRLRYRTALGSARETRAGLDVAEAFAYIEPLDPDIADRLAKVIGTLCKVAR